jgi:hypothetical protein
MSLVEINTSNPERRPYILAVISWDCYGLKKTIKLSTL